MSDRPVATDALATLGTIIGPDEKRDAIHIAVAPTQASGHLHPGDHVDAEGNLVRPHSEKAVGIVDPYLNTNVARGEYFWLLIYPRKINSLRHVWEHPAFPNEVAAEPQAPAPERREAAKAYLERRATDAGLTLDEMLEAIGDSVSKERPWVSSSSGSEPDEREFDEMFWHHWSAYTGMPVPHPDGRPEYFSCSC